MAEPQQVLPFDEAFLPYWHAVAYASELREKPLPVKLLGRDLVIWRTPSGPAATDRYCAHRGTDLVLGEIVGDKLRCGFHGWSYEKDGRCALIPSQPKSAISPKAKLGGYLAAEKFNLIWVCLSAEPRAPLPAWEDTMENASQGCVQLPKLEWKLSAGRWLENLVDVTHLSWVHRGTFGNPDQTEVPPYDVQVSETGIKAQFSYPALSPAHAGLKPKVDRTGLKYDVHWPFAGRLEFKPTVFFQHTVHLAACPVGEGQMVGFYQCTYDKRLTMFPDIFTPQELKIIEQDRVLLETQRSPNLPVAFEGEVHVRADRLGVEYRRGLARIRAGKPVDVTLEGD